MGQLQENQADIYMQQLKKVYVVDSTVLDGMDWFLVIAGAIGTIFCTIAFIYWLGKLLVFIYKVSRAKAKFNDKRFWKQMATGFILIILFMTGSLVMLFSRIFDFLAVWGWKVS